MEFVCFVFVMYYVLTAVIIIVCLLGCGCYCYCIVLIFSITPNALFEICTHVHDLPNLSDIYDFVSSIRHN
jgi:hypothetical protein